MSSEAAYKEGLSHHAIMMAMSITAIVETLSIDGPLGWRVVFPLIAIYPGIVALIGWSLSPWSKPRHRGSPIRHESLHRA
jgi:hypothetical protein